MKITFLIQDISTHGGTERTTCCLASEMARHGHDVTILSVFHNEQHLYPMDEKVKIEFLSNDSYTLESGTIGRAKSIIRQLPGIRKSPTLQASDIIISQKWLASIFALLGGYTHKTFACEHFRYAMYSRPVRFIRDSLYRHFRKLVVLTEEDCTKFKQKGLTNVIVIPNMISVTPLPYKGADSKRIISVGRLNFQKGYDLLLPALAQIKDQMAGFTVDIYGDGDDLNSLTEQRNQLGLEQIVHFCGFASNIEQEYANSCFYVMSSRFEGFPMVLLEAAACSLPIVSFSCPEGPKTLLANGGGLLVEAENISALAQAVLQMITDSNLREKCRNELPTILHNYLPETIYFRWENLFQA